MPTLKQLKEAANEMADVMIITPKLDQEATVEKAQEWITQAIGYIRGSDKFSAETQTIIDEWDIATPVGKITSVKSKDESVDLTDQIKKADSLKELGDIARANDEFKSIRGRLASYKTISSLEQVMLQMLVKEEETLAEKEEAAEEEQPKKVTKVTKPTEPSKPKEQPVIKAPKPVTFTRVDSVCEALKKGVKSLDELVEKSDEIYSGKTSKPPNKYESRTVSLYVLNVLSHFDVGLYLPPR